jgi:hypothetical protein
MCPEYRVTYLSGRTFNKLQLQRFSSEKGNIIDSFGKSRFANRDQFLPGCSHISIQVLSGALLPHPTSAASLDQQSEASP